MKVIHMGDLSIIQDLINAVNLHFLESGDLPPSEIDEAIQTLEGIFPQDGIIIEASKEELKKLGGELLDEEVEIRKTCGKEAWRKVWAAAKEFWLIRSSQAMQVPYSDIKIEVTAKCDDLKAALDETEVKP